MLGMRTCLPCHIPDRWSRGANAFDQISPSASSTRDLGTRLPRKRQLQEVLSKISQWLPYTQNTHTLTMVFCNNKSSQANYSDNYDEIHKQIIVFLIKGCVCNSCWKKFPNIMLVIIYPNYGHTLTIVFVTTKVVNI